MVKKTTKNHLFWKRIATIILPIFILDILIKQIVKHNNIHTTNGIFDITYITNKGTMWSLFAQANYGNTIFILLSILALGFLYYYLKTEKKHYIPTSMIAAGILGNLFDRIVYGYVIDWANFHFFPIFNIADSAIVCGIAWLVFLLIKEEFNN